MGHIRQDAAGIGEVNERNRGILPMAAQTLMLVALWSISHRYKGITGDAALYAIQAMAKVHPNLAADLFLQNTSQDKYTVFSPFYAWCIGCLGLRNAALILATVFKVWLFAAAWALARALTNSGAAFMAVALLIVTVGTYGAFSVFRYAEDFLTARSAAEALVVTAFAFHFSGRGAVAVLICSLAVLVHPLMALPGVLVLVCLRYPLHINLASAAAGIVCCLGMALWAAHASPSAGLLTVIDPEWREMIHERSVFLFLQDWHLGDWTNNARPFLSLTITAMALGDGRVRKLCTAAMLVGAVGLAVAFIASTVGPIALLIQGQAWRWEWIACFVSVLLLVPTACAIYRDTRCGPLCALLVVAGWTFISIDGAVSLTIALVIWAAKEHIDSRTAIFLRWAAVVLGLVIAAWTMVDIWHAAFGSAGDAVRSSSFIARIRNIAGLQIPAIVLAMLLAWWIARTRSRTMLAFISLLLGGAAAWVLPGSLKDTQHDGADAETREFSAWRAAISPTGNILVLPSHNSATFAWFLLDRPSYLSVDQSAGVVFSRAVAMEVKRRSEVLLPLMPPDWRLLTASRSAATSANHGDHLAALPLTIGRLMSVCQDPELGFVVARESVGADAARHEPRGEWKDWNLYDCQHVRSLTPNT